MYKEKIEELLRGTKRAGIEELIKHMEENGFFTAPCSTRFHLAEDRKSTRLNSSHIL